MVYGHRGPALLGGRVVGIGGHLARAAATLLVAGAVSGANAMRLTHATEDGIELYGALPPKGAKFDVPILSDRDAVVAMKKAVSALIAGSPLNAKAIGTLKANGRVIVIYDPAFPKERETEFEVAAYYPHFYDPDGTGGRDFLVVVGRHGIKWPTRELAAVLAHELAGHAMQRLRGQFESMRGLDRECQAELYQEQAIQDLRVSKGSPFMVSFRRDLEQRYCSDFKRYQAMRQPSALRLWNARNPNVPRLLASFRDYLTTRVARADEPR